MIERAFAITALTLAAVHALAARHEVAADGIAYLDLADAWLSGDLARVVNGYWSPMYPLLLVPAALVRRASPYWEAAAAHAVNLAIYAAAVAAFAFLVQQVRTSLASREVHPDETRTVYLPSALWLSLAWSLFLWTSIEWTPPRRVVPDLLVSALVYVAAGLVLRIRDRGARHADALLLGLVLGAAYLTKAVMLDVGAVLILAAALSSKGSELRTAVLCFTAFACVSVPWITALSSAKGRLTFGDTGKLNYAWYVNGVTLHVHWQGEPPGYGKPLHPTRQILPNPDVYEFAKPVAGTYPPWFDPSYWYEGVKPRLNLAQQVRRSARNCPTLLLLAAPGVFLGVFSLATRRCLWRLDLHSALNEWALWVPGTAALLAYTAILVLRRYIAPFAVLLWLAALAGLRVVPSPKAEQWSRRAVLAVVLPILLFVGGSSVYHAATATASTVRGPSHPHWEVAQALRKLGVRQGDAVACFGCAGKAYWARVAGVRVIAEAYDAGLGEEEDTFAAAGKQHELITVDGAVRKRVLDAFRTTGARVIVTREVPPHAVPHGWYALGRTNYYAYPLQ